MKRLLFFILLVFLCLQCDLHASIVAHSEVLQGRSFIVFLTSSKEVLSASASFDGKKYPLYEYENGKRAIIPARLEALPGNYPIIVESFLNNGIETFEASIVLTKKEYPKVSFYLKPSKKKLLKKGPIADDWGEIEKKIISESPKKHWEGFFIKPVDGITTMAFGLREYINGNVRGRHRGWDFRAPVGTPVKASNNGYIVYSGFLNSFGGTIVIDHGQGVNSLYFHLSKNLAKEGDFVKKGDIVALSGNTGISSGPHLHWGLSLHNVRIDPRQWVMTVMP